MINFNKLNLVETIEAEQASSEKAAMSSEKKNNPSHLVRQKSQMAGKMSTAKKSDVVYASEEYFRRLTSQVKLYKAQESAKVDWRETLEEAKNEKPEEEGNHPYIKLMPFSNPKQKQKEKAVQSQTQPEPAMSESIDFEEAFANLVSEAKETNNIAFQMVKDKLKAQGVLHTPGKPKSPEEKKADAARKAKNYADNNKNYDPYKARAGESD